MEPKIKVKYLNEKVETMDMCLDRHGQYSRRNRLLIHGVKENEKEDTDEVVIKFFEKEMKEKLSSNDMIGSVDLEKNKLEVDLGLLLSDLPGTMFIM